MDRHKKILSHLALIARDVAPVAAARIASALVYKREILAVGVCQYKSHPMQKEYCSNEKAIFLHSEIDCIKNAVNARVDPETIAKSTLYVSRQRIIDKKWHAGLACPCIGCQRAIAAFNISEVIYSLNDNGYSVFN